MRVKNKLKYSIAMMSFLLISLFIMSVLAGCSKTIETDSVTGKAVAGTGGVETTISNNTNKIEIYFFWGDGCPHCAHEKPFLEELQQKYPEIEVKMFETWRNRDNAKLFSDVAQAYGTSAQGVPTTFIDDKYWVGYADYMGEEMESKIKYCLQNKCINPGDKLR